MSNSQIRCMMPEPEFRTWVGTANGSTELQIGYTADQMEQFAETIIRETLEIDRVGMEFGPSMETAVFTIAIQGKLI